MTGKRVHIIKRDNGWAVKKQGGSKASKIYKDKKVAKKRANSLRKKGYDLIIHKRDGSIEEWKKASK